MTLEREDARYRLLSDFPGLHPVSGVPPWGPRCISYRTFFQSVLSDVLSSLIFALDHGWSFSFLYSTSLFALFLENEFYYGRKCSSVDQINVLVNFVPGQQRKRQPHLFQE